MTPFTIALLIYHATMHGSPNQSINDVDGIAATHCCVEAPPTTPKYFLEPDCEVVQSIVFIKLCFNYLSTIVKWADTCKEREKEKEKKKERNRKRARKRKGKIKRKRTRNFKNISREIY